MRFSFFKKKKTARDSSGSVKTITDAQALKLKQMHELGEYSDDEYKRKVNLLPKRR
jgi:hypothetical protein